MLYTKADHRDIGLFLGTRKCFFFSFWKIFVDIFHEHKSLLTRKRFLFLVCIIVSYSFLSLLLIVMMAKFFSSLLMTSSGASMGEIRQIKKNRFFRGACHLSQLADRIDLSSSGTRQFPRCLPEANYIQYPDETVLNEILRTEGPLHKTYPTERWACWHDLPCSPSFSLSPSSFRCSSSIACLSGGI